MMRTLLQATHVSLVIEIRERSTTQAELTLYIVCAVAHLEAE